MMIPNMRARISQLHKTESEWSALPDFKPFSGEIVVFDPDDKHSYIRLKIGDGKTFLKDLPFFIDSTILAYLANYDKAIDAGRITKYLK